MIIMMSFVLVSLILINAATDMVIMPDQVTPTTSNPPTNMDNNTNQSESSIVPDIASNNIITENSEKITATSAPILTVEASMNFESNETPNTQYEAPSNDNPLMEPNNATIDNITEDSDEEEEVIPLADIRSSNDFD